MEAFPRIPSDILKLQYLMRHPNGRQLVAVLSPYGIRTVSVLFKTFYKENSVHVTSCDILKEIFSLTFLTGKCYFSCWSMGI